MLSFCVLNFFKLQYDFNSLNSNSICHLSRYSSTKYTIKVKEPINGESEQLVSMESYIPTQNILKSFQSIGREKLVRLLEATQVEVKLKGTKICKGLPIADTGYTEDFANGKIKIMSANKIFWDTPKNWYACES